jgi:uncharacterized membrane protein YdbT with pleckstrin-like domain
MKYVERVLQPGETLVYLTSLHWLVYGRAIVLLLLAIGAAIGSVYASSQTVTVALEAIAAFFAIAATISGLHQLIRRATTELAITDRRVIYKTGVLQRHTLEINRSKIETVAVDQSLFGRLLRYGTVIVRGTGGSFEPIAFIGEPLAFRSQITAG